MSFKDSMIRGLAMYGMSAMSQYGRPTTTMMRDMIDEADKSAR
ncbi:MAG: hypothetical protein E6586_04675 [Bifidobacterium scardovii]|nr:hypothetical protein [Bifidobacterium scardovii]MDU2422658.1 hypothetical protein [Bifidobacterium scardovii]MDU3735906.1 hypothetical protein [Bifidobacterium scardovii]MDU5296385.1 hypothetical protein [Bifidobacterium scardovii]MDU5610956.1 hypothetical protein [Bifidobacterium scardovii]MDU5886275.1 hypothetical protein [Bifidobacterium scardovii]